MEPGGGWGIQVIHLFHTQLLQSFSPVPVYGHLHQMMCLLPSMPPIIPAKCAWAAAGAPNGTFYGNGLLGQRVIVVPSQDLVIARMGLNFLNDFDPVPAPPPPLACRSLY